MCPAARSSGPGDGDALWSHLTPSTGCQVQTRGGEGQGCEWGLLVRCHLSMALRGWGRLRPASQAAGHTGAVPGSLRGEGVPTTPPGVFLIQRGVDLLRPGREEKAVVGDPRCRMWTQSLGQIHNNTAVPEIISASLRAFSGGQESPPSCPRQRRSQGL